MTVTDSYSNIPIRRNFFGFGFKTKANTPKQPYIQPEKSSHTHASSVIPRQAYNPAIHPLLVKPVAREENFVLLPIRNGLSKRKRDPNSPVRINTKPKGREPGMSEWSRYLSSYAEVIAHHFYRLSLLIVFKGRFNMTNPPEPPSQRPAGYLKAPIPSNDKERVNVHPVNAQGLNCRRYEGTMMSFVPRKQTPCHHLPLGHKLIDFNDSSSLHVKPLVLRLFF